MMTIPGLDGTISVMGQKFRSYRRFIIGLGAVMLVSVYLLLNRTRLGIISFGHALFFGAGAYALAGMLSKAKLTLLVPLPLAVVRRGGSRAGPGLAPATPCWCSRAPPPTGWASRSRSRRCIPAGVLAAKFGLRQKYKAGPEAHVAEMGARSPAASTTRWAPAGSSGAWTATAC